MADFGVLKRFFFTSSIQFGKRNFRKFQLFNKRGTRQFKESQKINPSPLVPIYSKLTFYLSNKIKSIINLNFKMSQKYLEVARALYVIVLELFKPGKNKEI